MSAQFDVKNFTSTLTCPIEFKPLTSAVNLFPCCHKVNQVAAEHYYGKMVAGFCESREKPCIICKSPVTGWAPDHTIRDLASQVFGHTEELESLPTHPLVLEEVKAEVDLPYPGIPAVFVLSEGDWSERFNIEDSTLCKSVSFKSITKNSLLIEFILLGYSCGKVCIYIIYQDRHPLEEYLLAHRIVLDGGWGHKTETQKDLRTLFRIIALNNEIPAEQFSQIREAVELGTC